MYYFLPRQLKYLFIAALFTLTRPVPAQTFCWTPLGDTIPIWPSTFTDGFNVLCTDGYTIYGAGGLSTDFSGSLIYAWNPQAGWTVEQVVLDTPNGGGPITGMCLDNQGNLYVSGAFADGYYVKESGGNWTTLGNDTPFHGNPIYLCSDGNNIYAGGTMIDNSGYYYIAEWNGSSWSELGQLNSTQPIVAMCFDPVSYKLYIIARANSTDSTNFAAAWDGSQWSNLNIGASNVYGLVTSMCPAPGGGILVVDNQNDVGYWNSSSWSNLQLPALDIIANAIALDSDSNIYVGGGFNNYGNVWECPWGTTAWVPAGGSCQLHANGTVNTLCGYKQGIVAAGNFTAPFNNYNYEAYLGPYIATATFISLNISNVNCSSQGSITSSIHGGTGPYAYLWSNGDTTPNLTNLSAGYYTLSVTDSLGALAIAYAQVDSACYSYVTGTYYEDVNRDCVMDSGDLPIENVFVTLIEQTSGQQYYATTSYSGQFIAWVPDTGKYVIDFSQISQCSQLENCQGHSDTVDVPALGDTINSGNLPFLLGAVDLTMHPGWSPANPGFQKRYWIMPYNAINQPYPGTATIIFTYDSNLIYQYSDMPLPTVDTVAHTLKWIVPSDSISYPSFSFNDILVSYFMVPASLSLTYQLQNSFQILPYTGDCDTTNNYMAFSETCTGSHDPNAKQVSPAGNTAANVSDLTYTIYFRNTGTDSTHFIVVSDTLSPSLDPASVVNLASNPPYTSFSLTGQGVLTWQFDPVRLPPAATDSMGSSGFITFSIHKWANLPAGTEITNAANVFFDYNSPIVTDTTINTVLSCQLTDTVITTSICPGQVYIVGGIPYHTTGTFIDTLQSTGGCDSIVALNLTVNPIYRDTLSDSICSGDTFYVGHFAHTLAGNYTDTLNTIYGCDSIVNLTLAIRPAPIVTLSWDSLTIYDQFGLGFVGFEAPTIFYGQLDTPAVLWCINPGTALLLGGGHPYGGTYTGRGVFSDTLIVGEVDNGLPDTIIYSYIDSDGCQGKGYNFFVYGCEGIKEVENITLSLYPNPANDLIYIKTEDIQPQTTSIYDVNGQLVYTNRFTPQLDVSKLTPGAYLIEVNAPEGTARRMFVKIL